MRLRPRTVVGSKGSGGAGGTRTLVRQVVTRRATTIPVSWLMAATLPGQAGHEGPATGSFPEVSGLCRLSVVFPYRPPPLLVTGCGGQAPRAIAGRDDSLPTD